MDETRPTSVARSVAEALGALAGALAVALMLTAAATALVILTMPPATMRAEIPLLPVRGAAPPAASAGSDLLRILGHGSIAGMVALRDEGERRFLVLEGVDAPEAAEPAVLRALVAAGFRPVAFEFRRDLDPLQLLRDPWVLIPALAIQAGVFLVLGAGLARWRVRKCWRPTTGAGVAAGLGVACGAAAFVTSLGLAYALESLGLPVREQELLHEILGAPGGLARLAPWIVLAAPVAEEVFFRGYMFRFLAQGAGPRLALAVSAVAFAAAHLNPSGFLVYAAVGTLFAAVYSRTGRLLAPVAAHVAYNGITLTVWALTTNG